jgi:hypothetical protein
MRLAYPLIRSSVFAALGAAVLALVGLWPAANGPDRVVRPARCGWQRVDSTYLATHAYEDALPDSTPVATALEEPAPDVAAPPLARRSTRHHGATAWGTLADGTAPVTNAPTTSRPTHLIAHGQHGPHSAGRAPPRT